MFINCFNCLDIPIPSFNYRAILSCHALLSDKTFIVGRTLCSVIEQAELKDGQAVAKLPAIHMPRLFTLLRATFVSFKLGPNVSLYEILDKLEH
jgi:hypothetical protein